MLEELIETRYPQLLFLLKTCKQLSIEPSKQSSPAELGWIEQVKIQKPELILLVGLGAPEDFLSLECVLEQHPHTDLLIFEENLEVIASFLKLPHAERILSHSQIHLKYILEPGQLIQGLKEAVKEYPAENVLIEVTEKYRMKYAVEDLSLSVLRRATISSALFNEEVYYHLLFRNLLQNFLRLPESFYADTLKGKFKGIPAVICGAGPSLTAHIPVLKTLDKRALIIAGGSTLAALSSQGVHPHLGLALDPNPEEYDRLKANYDMQVPLLFASRVVPSVFTTCNGPKGYMRTFSGGLAELALEEYLGVNEESLFCGVSQEGISVTVMCFALAIRLGCNPIFLSGIDLAYTDGKRYADGVMQDSSVRVDELRKDHKVCERLVCRENRHGEEVYTTVKWIMEAQAIEDFAALHPEVQVFDCIKKGLGFKSLNYIDLLTATDQTLHLEYDLEGYVHQVIQEAPTFQTRREDVLTFLEELKKSVKSSQKILASLLEILMTHDKDQDPEENSRLTLYTMDLEEEKAFIYFLEPLQEEIHARLQKELRGACVQGTETYAIQISLLEQKWKHFQCLLKHYMTLFSAYA